MLLDKSRIAREASLRLEGSRALTNPKIPDGLLIAKVEEDPEQHRVDLDALHQRSIRVTERRGTAAATPKEPISGRASRIPPTDPTQSKSPNAKDASTGPTLLDWVIWGAGASLIAGLVALDRRLGR
jgi:hypothetical protein